MSYILEALKKVEQKQEQEETSRPPTFSSEHVEGRKRTLVWPYIVGAALLLNAGLALLLFGPWRAHQEVPSTLSSSAGTRDSAQGQGGLGVQRPVPATTDAVNEANPPKEGQSARVPGARLKTETEVAVPKARQKEGVETASAPITRKTPALSSDVPQGVQIRPEKPKPLTAPGTVMALNELPSSIRSSLPEFKISGHAYSPDPETRVVRVNEKILQEGQDLSPGLKVEEIIPDGIIFSYSGYRFRVGLKESR